MKPCDVNKSNKGVGFQRPFSDRKSKHSIKFKVGDTVRIFRFKTTYGNKYDPNWTREIFIINLILYTSPVTHKIKDNIDEEIEGTFYSQE